MSDTKGYVTVPIKETPSPSPTEESTQVGGCIKSIDEADVNCSSHVFNFKSQIVDYILIVPTMLFGTKGVPFLIIFVLLSYNQTLSIIYICSILTTVATTEIMKKIAKRPRPDPQLVVHRRWNVRGLLKNFAFPSGDSAQAGVFAVFITIVNKNIIYSLVIPPFAMLGRVYFGCHYFGDTVVGVLIGAFYTCLTFYLYYTLFNGKNL